MITELNSSAAWNRGEVFAGGRHLATYKSGMTYFIHSDWLGTERYRMPMTGAAETYTSLPFGDALTPATGGSSPDHFTGKERDPESGMDYFGARYYTSAIGRFIQVDPSMLSAVLRNPQSWNRYSYTLNNPLRYIDPDGELWVAAKRGTGYNWQDTCTKGQTCYNSISAVEDNNLVIYGSSNAQDMTTFQANDDGYVDLSQVASQHDADFTIKDGAQSFLSLNTVSDFFNATEQYKDQNPGGDKLVVTDAGKPDGSSFPPHKTHDHGRSVDVRYQDENGKNLQGKSAADSAGLDRTRNLVDSAKANGFNQNYSSRPKDFGTNYAPGHDSHLHLGKISPVA